MPTVSIIVPAFNAAKTIAETLKSTEAQEFQDFEVIVVDDGSTDATVEVVRREFSDVRVIEQENAGPAAARNHGAAEARGEWLAFLDADDTWLPWRLSLQLEAAKRQPEIGMWCAETIGMSDTVSSTPENSAGTVGLTLRDFAVSNPVSTTTVLLRRSLFEQENGFDTQFRGPEDYDLWMRTATHTEIGKIQHPVSRYRQEVGSLSQDVDKFLPEVLRVLTKAYGSGGALEAHGGSYRKARAYQYFSASWMAYCANKTAQARRLLYHSFFIWPFGFGRCNKERLIRAKLLFRYCRTPSRCPNEAAPGR